MKVFSVKKEQLLILLYSVVILAGVYTIYNNRAIATFSMPVSKKVILVDAGHGGWDPGKVGAEDTLEKDINLQIAKKLQVYLEQGGSYVLMTRVEDEALGDKKNSDMKGRKEIANNSNADMLISIHQNSYSVENVIGAQVFYYEGSEESKTLAESIQGEISEFTKQKKNREAKSNESYFVLKQTNIPAVIVECGFLSNPEERAMLSDDEYQEKMAWAIYKGIIKYYSDFT